MKGKKISVLFPGQGSQQLGMLSDLANDFPGVQATFAQASAVLNLDLWRLSQEGPAEDLDQTHNTQPCLLAADVAVWRICQETLLKEGAIASLAGHSLGEYSALVCAGAIDFLDAVELVRERGRLMQQAVPLGSGAMAAVIGLTAEQVQAVCTQASGIVEPANYNTAQQIVIAGETQAVERAVVLAKEAGAKAVKVLPVSVPSHCSLMKTITAPYQAALEKIVIQKPLFPVVSNVSATVYTEPAEIRAALLQQLTSSVRWVDGIEYMIEQGTEAFFECGPGRVLAGLNKRIDKDKPMYDYSTLLQLK